jgi:hypothetical protein
MRECVYRGIKRTDLPHKGPCCTPYECRHDKTPRVVNLRICGAGKCRLYTLSKPARTNPQREIPWDSVEAIPPDPYDPDNLPQQ